MLAERRVVLDDLETITAYAKDMSRFLRKSGLTETRVFINSFVKKVVVSPGEATIHYSIPMPDHGGMLGVDSESEALQGAVPSTVKRGCPARIRT